jgi:hypothetical protein
MGRNYISTKCHLYVKSQAVCVTLKITKIYLKLCLLVMVTIPVNCISHGLLLFNCIWPAFLGTEYCKTENLDYLVFCSHPFSFAKFVYQS